MAKDNISMISWNTNKLCNFSCPGCFAGETTREHDEVGKYNYKKIAKAFEKTGRTWQIHMSGGEPFLYPDFVDLCFLLDKNNYLSMNTNLSTSNVKDFSNKINPQKVKFINAAIHITEREKHKNGVEKFIDNYISLIENNFTVSCSYVSYPQLFSRIERDFEYFKSKGVDIVVKAFRGEYEGKVYPAAYKESEINLMTKLGMFPGEIKIANNKTNFFRYSCGYGYKDFVMDISGDVRRCSTSKKKYGNLFHGTFKPDIKSKPCPFKNCTCPYQGIRGTKDSNRSTSLASFLFELMTEAKSINKQAIFPLLRPIVRTKG